MKLAPQELRRKRHERSRKRIFGTAERPRLCVVRSEKHLYAQAVNDYEGKTLFSFSTLHEKFKKISPKGQTTEAAKKLGEIFGKELVAKGIQKVVFDRSGCQYHGRIKALAEALRETGVQF